MPFCGITHERNLNAAINLRNLLMLPADSGMMLRNGKALAVGIPNGETGPNDRRTATLSLRAPPTVSGGQVPPVGRLSQLDQNNNNPSNQRINSS